MAAEVTGVLGYLICVGVAYEVIKCLKWSFPRALFQGAVPALRVNEGHNCVRHAKSYLMIVLLCWFDHSLILGVLMRLAFVPRVDRQTH